MVCLLLVARLAARPGDDVLHPVACPRAPGPVLLVVVVTRDVEIHLEMAELSQKQPRVTSLAQGDLTVTLLSSRMSSMSLRMVLEP